MTGRTLGHSGTGARMQAAFCQAWPDSTGIPYTAQLARRARDVAPECCSLGLEEMPRTNSRRQLSDYPCYATVLALREHYHAIVDLDAREEACKSWRVVANSAEFKARVEQLKSDAKRVPIPEPMPCYPRGHANACPTRGKVAGANPAGSNWKAHPPSDEMMRLGPACPTNSCRLEHFPQCAGRTGGTGIIRCQCNECRPLGRTFERVLNGVNIRHKFASTRKADGTPGPMRPSHFHYECCIKVGKKIDPIAVAKAEAKAKKKRQAAAFREAEKERLRTEKKLVRERKRQAKDAEKRTRNEAKRQRREGAKERRIFEQHSASFAKKVGLQLAAARYSHDADEPVGFTRVSVFVYVPLRFDQRILLTI